MKKGFLYLIIVILLVVIAIMGIILTSNKVSNNGMTMDDMVNALEGKSGDEFDKAFIEHMIPHHQGAVSMAQLALVNSEHKEIKEMAQAIIDSQNSEIEQMKIWQNEWGYTEHNH
jgi:uncharacterized protein (DUF305 family)